VEKFSDIVRDGSEHVSRRFKVLTLRQRIKHLQREQRDGLRQLGKAAWQNCRESILQFDPGIAEQQALRDQILLEKDQKLKELSSSMDSKRDDHEDRETESLDFTEGLEELLTTRNKLKATRAQLEAEHQQLKQQKKDADDEPTSDSSEIDAAIKANEQEIKTVQSRQLQTREAIQAIHNSISNYRKAQQRFIDEVTSIEKMQRRIERDTEKALAPIDEQINAFYSKLGEELMGERPDCPDLSNNYSGCDLVETALEAAENSLESEFQLLGLLNRNAVIWFYALAGTSIVIFIGICWLLFVLFFL